MVVEKLYDQNNLTKTCYSGCRKTLFDQISKQSEHNKQNDRQNSNANMHDPVRYAIVDSLDCTLEAMRPGNPEVHDIAYRISFFDK